MILSAEMIIFALADPDQWRLAYYYLGSSKMASAPLPDDTCLSVKCIEERLVMQIERSPPFPLGSWNTRRMPLVTQRCGTSSTDPQAAFVPFYI